MSDALLAHRKNFRGLSQCTHMLSHSLGAMPDGARESANLFLEQWENQTSWKHWLPFVDEFGASVANVLGVDSDTIFFHQNCTTAQAVVASCFDWRTSRNKIVCSALDFPTQLYLWEAQSHRGARVEIVSGEKGGLRFSLSRFLEAIDVGTQIVAVSHVFYQTSEVADIDAITKRAHEVGALVLVDCYQSAGTIPLSLKACGVDFACGGSVKWMCGGPGAAYLYVNPDVRDTLEPTITGWFAHVQPFAFEPPPIRYAESAWRMAIGTPPMPALYTASGGWKMIEAIGVENIRKKSLRQTKLLLELVDARGFFVNSPRDDARRGGTVCFDFPAANAVTDELRNRRYLCDWRPRSGLRASPHFYTSDDEIHRFIEELDHVRRQLGPVASSNPIASV